MNQELNRPAPFHPDNVDNDKQSFIYNSFRKVNIHSVAPEIKFDADAEQFLEAIANELIVNVVNETADRVNSSSTPLDPVEALSFILNQKGLSIPIISDPEPLIDQPTKEYREMVRNAKAAID